MIPNHRQALPVKEMDIHPVSLSFRNEQRHLESEFKKDYYKTYLDHFRYCHLYSIVFYIFVGVLDYFLFPEMFFELWGIRNAIVIPIFLFGYLFTWHSLYENLWPYINNLYVVLTGAGFIHSIWIAPPPMGYNYYAGVIICFIFGYTFIRSRLKMASLAGWSLCILYFIVSIHINTPSDILFNNLYYILTMNILGMLVAYSIEYSARRDFYLRNSLAREKQNVQNANEALEQKILERTSDLMRSNRKLREEIEERHLAENENRKLELRLIQAHKLESIGTLAGGIAHDFNNILTAILGYTEMALDELNKETATSQKLQKVYLAGQRAKDLVKQILIFARQGDQQFQPVRVSLIVKEVLKLLRSILPASIEIKQNIKSNALILGDATQIYQVLMNLCTNAAYAMDENGGVLEITLEDFDSEIHSSRIQSVLKSGKYIKMIVSDTGKGMEPEVLKHIFEPYFTTKKHGEGTGMGLSVVHGIIKGYEGEIDVESRPGRGTRFTIYIPVTSEQEKSEEYVHEQLPEGKESILFIDDEEAIANMFKGMLETLGYSVTAQTDSSEALKLFSANPDRFDLVITDMTMPKMTGDKLALEINKIRHGFPIILCSGFNKKLTDDNAEFEGIKAIITKPISRENMAKIIRQVLAC